VGREDKTVTRDINKLLALRLTLAHTRPVARRWVVLGPPEEVSEHRPVDVA
jgi:hypothetical protein